MVGVSDESIKVMGEIGKCVGLGMFSMPIFHECMILSLILSDNIINPPTRTLFAKCFENPKLTERWLEEGQGVFKRVVVYYVVMQCPNRA